MYFDSIQLNLVLNKVASYAEINDTKELILNEDIIFNPLKIKENLLYTSDALKLLNNPDISFSLKGINDVRGTLNKASKQIILTNVELLNLLVFYENILKLKKVANHIDENNEIKSLINSLYINNEVFDYIKSIIDTSGNIKDNASNKLIDINSKINENNALIDRKISLFIKNNAPYLQESVYYIRNNRVTFLIQESYKNRYNGYIYGSSASGLASYVEPKDFIELNNSRVRLEDERDDEIARLLLDISIRLSYISEFLLNDYNTILLIDEIFSKARFGFNNNGVVSKFNENDSLILEDVAHPLIDEKKVVVNTYRLKKPYSGIVVSGTNTGGKTVSLKTIGISVLMTYLGIPVICKSANIPFFKNIFIDIDDNQSILDSLSTFSSHISNINSILNSCDENSLVLIDELISGTDPKEAEAISLAILDELINKKSKFIITTHFDEIKKYAYNNEHILLSSVGFNLDTLQPTYKYIENLSGESNAIEIASKYLDDKNIIENSRRYLNKNKTDSELLFEKLNNQINEYNLLLEQNNKTKFKYESLKKEYEDKLNKLNNEYDSKLKDINIRLNDYLTQKTNEINNILDDLNNKKDLSNIKKRIDNVSIKKEKKQEAKEEIKIGDRVAFNDSSRIGEVLSIDGKIYEVGINNLRIKAKESQLRLLPNAPKVKTTSNNIKLSRVPTSINFVGYHVSDALEELEPYITRAYGSKMSSVKIIHGFGTLKLKNAIRDKLKTYSFVESFKDGEVFDGGAGATIVTFKKQN